MKRGLAALALGGLSIGMAEFTIMGILPDIASDIHEDIPVTAHLISLYALGVAIGAPTLVLLTAKFPPRKVMMWFMFVFFVFHGLFALSPNFTLMKTTRLLAGLPHGAFFGVGSVVAALMAEKGKEAQAISIMFMGLTLANLLGVPLGTYLGHHFSWRLTYGLISLLGLVTIIAIYFWLPDYRTNQDGQATHQLRYFKSTEAWYLIFIVAIGTGGLFAWVSYIAPLVETISGLPARNVPVIMVLVGMGMFVGNLLGGKIADTLSPTKSVMVSFSAVVLCLIFVYYTSPVTWTAYPMSFITGMVTFTIGPPIQILLIRTAHGAETLAAAVGQASFNLGNTLGAFLGGIPVTLGFAYNIPVLVGSGLALVGVAITLVFYRRVILRYYR